MKPKLIYTLVLLFLVKISLFSQIVNVNPDPNGDPWIAGDVILLSTEEEDSIPNMVLSSESAGLQLPSYVDNSTDTISTGGVAVLAVYETSWKPDTTLPQGSPMAGQKYLYELGTSGPHEITIVGYHDSVHCFDLNPTWLFNLKNL